LLRQWHVSLWLSHRGYTRRKPYRYKFLEIPGVLDGRYLLVGPPSEALTPGGASVSRELVPSGARYFLLRGAGNAAKQADWVVHVSGPAGCALQVTVVRLTGPVAQMTATSATPLSVDDEAHVDLRIVLQESAGVPVVLKAVVWEDGQEPTVWNRLTRVRPVVSDVGALRRLFGANRLAAGGTLRSRTIRVGPVGPGTRDLIIKVLGQDPKGRLVTAQTRVPVGGRPEDRSESRKDR